MLASFRIKEVTGRPDELRITIHRDCTSEEELLEYIEQLIHLYTALDHEFVCVWDLRNASALPSPPSMAVNYDGVARVSQTHLIATYVCIPYQSMSTMVSCLISIFKPIRSVNVFHDWNTMRENVRKNAVA